MSKKNNPHYKGEPTPKHLQHGPVDDRRCTDIICLIIFLISWGGIIAVAIYSFHNGTPMDLTYVFDQYDRPCGIGNQSAYPYLFFNASFTDDSDWSFSPSSTVCVQQCPDNYNETVLCLPDPSDSDANCTGIYSYSSTIFIDRFCVPTNAVLLGDLYNASVFSANFFYQNMSDLQKTWWMMIVVALFALIFGFLYLFLMRHFAGALLWGLIACFVLILVAFGIICLEDATGSTDLTAITPANLTRIDPLVLYLIAVACFLVAFITIVVICCFRTRINLSIAVLKAAADFIEEEKGTLIIPPLMFIKSVVFYIFWIFVLIFIIGTNTYVPDEDHYPIGDLQWNSKAIGMLIYHIFALFWNHCFGVALSQFIIASAACLWYFTQGRSNMRKPVVWTSFKRSFLHMGSIALGSFLISVLGFIRLIIDFFNRRLNKESAQGEEKGFCLSCCACCFKCFELCLKFISRHAYIQIAMTGEGFCKATEEAYYLLARNAVRFGLVHGLAWLFLFIGQLFITLLSAFLGYIIITKDSTFSNNIYSPVGPTILFFLISWLVADVFMAIYGVSADTIIHCFAMDEEIHDGIAEHAPKDLRDFINGNLHQKLLPDE